jgi:hypothetical protein
MEKPTHQYKRAINEIVKLEKGKAGAIGGNRGRT